MPNQSCPISITCPGSDTPVSNYSSEKTDGVEFVGLRYPNWDWTNPYGDGGPYPSTFNAQGCLSVCLATTQELADLCAAAQAYICANPSSNTFFNEPQSCTVGCPDGTQTTFTTPAGTFAAANQTTANTLAHDYACQKANEMRLCFNASTSQPTRYPRRPPTLLPLTPYACLNGQYDDFILAYPASVPVTFEIVSGSLPPGLDLTTNELLEPFGACEISGSATTIGSYTFSVKATDARGRTVTKSFTIAVMGITTDSALPDANVGSPYSEQLDADGGTAPYTFSTTPDEMPPWLTCSSDGLLEGTPTEEGTDTFIVTVTDANGISCAKEFSVTTTNANPWSCTETNPSFECNNSGSNWDGRAFGPDGFPLGRITWTFENTSGPQTTRLSVNTVTGDWFNGEWRCYLNGGLIYGSGEFLGTPPPTGDTDVAIPGNGTVEWQLDIQTYGTLECRATGTITIF